MDNLQFHLPTLLILAPAAGGLIAMSMVSHRSAGIVSLLTFLVQAVFIGLAVAELGGQGFGSLVPEHQVTWLSLYNASYHVRIDAMGVALIALTTLVTFCAAMFAWYANRPRPALFHGLLWLTAAPLCGLFLVRDLLLFYVFFELMLIPVLFLIGGWGGSQRIRAALTMFIYTLVGSLLMLVGVLAVGVQAQTFSLDELALAGQQFPWWALVTFLVAFAIKAPLLPFHGWLPLTYREAPAEVSAVLSGLISKAAMFGLLVVVLPLFPTQMAGNWGGLITWLAVAGLLYGSITAFRQPDARGVVAYSSIAQMGLIVLGLSVYLGEGGAQGVGGAVLHTLNHGLVSAALFLIIGVVEIRTGTGQLSRLGGLAVGRPVFASIALVVALCALAVPGSVAFAGELLILGGVFRAPWEHSWLWTVLAASAIVLAAMYVLRLVAAVMQTPGGQPPAELVDGDAGAPRDTEPPIGVQAVKPAWGPDLRGAELLAVVPLVLGILALSIWPNMAHDAMNDPTVLLQDAAAAAGAGEVRTGEPVEVPGAPEEHDHEHDHDHGAEAAAGEAPE